MHPLAPAASASPTGLFYERRQLEKKKGEGREERKVRRGKRKKITGQGNEARKMNRKERDGKSNQPRPAAVASAIPSFPWVRIASIRFRENGVRSVGGSACRKQSILSPGTQRKHPLRTFPLDKPPHRAWTVPLCQCPDASTPPSFSASCALGQELHTVAGQLGRRENEINKKRRVLCYMGARQCHSGGRRWETKDVIE